MTRTVFTGGRLFDGTGAALSEADVVIGDGRVLEVGTGLDGDTSVDCSGKTILPGLFDCHVHVTANGPDLLAALNKPFSFPYYEAVVNLRRTLDAGITTVRDAGGADLGVKEAVDRGLIEGPRMKISVTILSQTGGHADGWMVCGVNLNGPPVPGNPTPLVDGVADVRRKVRELIRAGADQIKVCTSGGVLSPRDDPRHAHFRPDELEEFVAQAAAAHTYVMAHAQATDGIKNAIRAGIRSIEHGVFLDEEAISMMLERGTWLVPTLSAPLGVLEAVEAGANMPPQMVAKARDVIGAHRESIRQAIAAGVRIAMGTDSGVGPHGTNLRELQLMAELGMAPEAVLLSTTSSAATLLGVESELGTLETGKRADLVVVGGNPLDFAGLRERVEQVWKDGRLVAGG
ncbi:MAG: amidohydrolase family protein [Acidimicrobiales bacterium]|jgi:imidazolonepropionase-like amidohydrolase